MSASEEIDYETAETDTEEDGSELQHSGIFRWPIHDFPGIQNSMQATPDKQYGSMTSEVFVIGGCQWQLLLFPNGNGAARGVSLSLYLLVADKDVLPEGWRREARFWLYVVNQLDEKKTVRQQTSTVATDDWEHNWKPPEPFSASKHDWGFPSMIPLGKLTEHEGFLSPDGTLIIQTEIAVFRAWIDYKSLRTQRLKSREETGHVGIYNQGATCYLNAWLQALFHTGVFRRAVYQIPTASANVAKNIPLALQRLFYRLQFHDDSVESKELTTAFGWSAEDVSQQHDVHELNCKLLDNLEKKMKGTPSDGAIQNVFRGEIINYIECVNVDYKSERPEEIYDIGLVVKGCADIYESFDKYIEVEMLDGENQYHAEGFGLQDARRGVRFSRLPPVLMLHLQRWELDMVRFVTYKVNDKFIYHPVLDLTKYLPAGSKDSGIYHLHSILVHTGIAGAGHYYAYVRPNIHSQWFLFDDSRVATATEKQAIEDNWGGFEEHSWVRFGNSVHWKHPRSANAYMLLYVRETEVHDFMGFQTGEDVIPEHIHKVGEEHLYIDLHVAVGADLRKHDQAKLDLILRKEIHSVKAKRQETLLDFTARAAEQFGIPPKHQRYWLFSARENETFRPERSLTLSELASPIEDFVHSRTFSAAKKMLYLEDTRETCGVTDEAPEEIPEPVVEESPTHALIFFKFYDPQTQVLEFVGSHMFSKLEQKISDFIPVCQALKGFSADTPLLLWEEFSPSSTPALDMTSTIDESHLQVGDIVVFALPVPEGVKYSLPDPPSWYSWKRHGVVVRFRKYETPTDGSTEFSLELSKRMTYDEVAQLVAEQLKVEDHQKIRFTGISPHLDGPRTDPCPPHSNLKNMLTHYLGQPLSDILFYEILPFTLLELHSLQQFTITVQTSTCQIAQLIKVYVPKDGVIQDVIDAVLARIDPAIFTHGTKQFRLFEVFHHKIRQLFSADTPVSHIPYHEKLVLEEFAPEELTLETGDLLLPVAHFQNSIFNNPSLFGNPFYFLFKAEDTVNTIKPRIQARFQVPDDQFATWRFAIVDFSTPKFPRDDDPLLRFGLTPNNYYVFFALQHPDDTPDIISTTWHQQLPAHEERTLKFGDDDE